MITKARQKTIILLLSMVCIIQFVNAQEAESKFEKIKELGSIEEYLYTPNGMNMLLVQDNSAPVVTVQIVYRVGSKHEVPGNTGSTHLLEHLNFKGTPTFNKRNGNAIFNVLQGMGAQMNATTWNDRTNYYETIPSDKIETALHIESDRMRNSLLLKEDKDAEMTVVRNEFERGENNPNSLLSKEMWATAYMAHPYHHSTIGWRSDIENMPIEALRKFYNTYYWPDNATLTIIGDFQKESLFNLVDKYFGKITKAPHNMPQPYTEEPAQLGPRRIVIKKPGQQGIVSIGYKIPGRLHDDLPALQVLSQIIGSGTSSIINKTFVDTGLALFGFSSASNFKEVGMFTVSLGFAPNKNHEAMNTQMLEMINNVKNEGVLQEDVDRIVAKLNAQTILSRDGSGSIAGQLTEAIAGGDWTDYITGNERLGKVTAEDVKRVANTYLLEDQSTTGYFVPKISGGNKSTGQKLANYTSKDSKYFYRNPNHSNDCEHDEYSTRISQTMLSEITSAYETIKATNKGEKFTRKTVAGIDVITAKTGAKDFLTVSASFPIGGYLNTNANEMVPSLTTQMLSKGTINHDKFQFSQKLEKLGVGLRVNAGTHKVNISFKCLKKDLKMVIDLLAEELRYPLFDEKEFELLKQQNAGGMKRGLTDPGTQGAIALSQAIYPKGHPNYSTDIQTSIDNLNKVTLDELKAFHKSYFGPEGMHLVAVGDIDTNTLYTALKKAFKGWKGGSTNKAQFEKPEKSNALTKVVTIPQKPSAEMYIGQYTGIHRMDNDYLPFYMGTSILGGGFSGRLMQTVRDNDGLTYSIGASHSGHSHTGGYWSVNASFNPNLFQKGLDATMVQIKKWVNEGITNDELTAKKTNLTGSFKVGLSTTGGLAGALLSFVERGLEPSYVDQYSKDIEAVTIGQVNTAIKKYIDLNKLIIIKSGSLDENGAPLK
ncbi:M16 family metallopeptidase [Flavivirga spongiicola]|uniref:Insulinase family protein n=1 Tax=Flavivirga spongiicola TaxID=421621 RepID=A0ABU7XQ06_9FLAO|nr:pitrilysin family protein [Flavivirga sp. MEBiC05379]MDO5977855.1 pitrilysin family protein [Flavivirga sp. MEBiC05379]